jgi:Fur family zinc uptake transcriptional regulator
LPEKNVLSNFRPRDHNHKACIERALKTASTVCRERGLRLTPLRRRVLELVWQQHMPVGAYVLLDALRKDGRRADPPTVYRALEFLLGNGFVHRIESLNAYVGCGQPEHKHSGQFLICGNCNRVAELEDPAISRIINEKAHGLGFRISQQTIEVTGLCGECREYGVS